MLYDKMMYIKAAYDCMKFFFGAGSPGLSWAKGH